MGKFSAEEKMAIMKTARAHIATWHAEQQQQRNGGGAYVTKTTERARAPVSKRTPAEPATDAQTASWVEWVLDTVAEALGKTVDNLHESMQEAFDRRDAKIRELRDEVEIKIGLGRRLTKLKGEIERATNRQPSYEAELKSLRERVARQEKLITRLRGEQSQLRYTQEQLAAEQTKSRQHLKITEIELTNIGSATRTALQVLQEETGFDLTGEVLPPSRLAS
jgi:chromosome segregation ATPase